MISTTRTRRRLARTAERWAVYAGLALTTLAVAAATGPAALGAQEEEAACRCVDRDGNEIENCRCLRTFSVEPMQAMGLFPRRAMIGVTISAAQTDDVDRQGARIEQVRDGGPADRGGLEAGDIVVRVGEQSLFDPLDDADAERSLDLDQSVPVQRFQRLVAGLTPGEPVEFEVLRDGNRRTLTVTPERAEGLMRLGLGDGVQIFGSDGLHLDLQGLREGSERMRGQLEELAKREGWERERPGVYRFRTPEHDTRLWSFEIDTLRASRAPGVFNRSDPCFDLSSSTRSGGGNVWVFGTGGCVEGVEFVDVNPELGEYFGSDHGALAAEVAEGSELGLRPGDVVIAVDGREVRDAEQVRRILRSYEADEEMRLRIVRRGEEIEVLGRRR